MGRSLSIDLVRQLAAPLRAANTTFMAAHPGDGGRRQPVHSFYGGAHLFAKDSAARLGEAALASLDEHAPDFAALARAIGLPGAAGLPVEPDAVAALAARIAADPAAARRTQPAAWLAHTVERRVREKLAREPVEDLRADFEDGYGNRPDEEEDAHAVAVGEAMAEGAAAGTLPPFFGIRIKPFTEELYERSVRTLDLLLTTLVRQAGGLPPGFLINLAKVTVPEQPAALAALLDRLEQTLALAPGSLRCELMVETPQAIFGDDGTVALPRLVAAARGRCVAAHFGTYDFTAGCNITAAHQHMSHPACDFARQVMQIALAGTGVWLSDGGTNVLPLAPHRASPETPLTTEQQAANRATVHRAWRLHHDHIRHSLVLGLYQGWDLHPAQLPSRFATVYAFFLEALEAAAERLRNFVAQAAQATRVGEVFDDAATGQGLLNFFLRAINCGAITEQEAGPLTGLSADELRGGSFLRILAARRHPG